MENLFYLIIASIVALFFVIAGIWIMKRKKPVRLYSTVKVSADEITDVNAYNHAVGRMWCIFAIPVFIAGIIELWFPIVSVIVFCLICTVGIGGTVWYYHKIEEKYFVR